MFQYSVKVDFDFPRQRNISLGCVGKRVATEGLPISHEEQQSYFDVKGKYESLAFGHTVRGWGDFQLVIYSQRPLGEKKLSRHLKEKLRQSNRREGADKKIEILSFEEGTQVTIN